MARVEKANVKRELQNSAYLGLNAMNVKRCHRCDVIIIYQPAKGVAIMAFNM